MKSKPAITLTALVVASFAATLAVVWLQGEPGPHPAAKTSARSSRPWWPPAAPAPRRSAEVAASAPVPAARRLDAPAAAAAAEEVPPADAGGPPLPVILGITSRRERLHDDPDDDGAATAPRFGEVWQVDLYSNSDQPLQLTVVATDTPTQETSHAQVLVMPHTQAHLGAESGLKLEPGNLVALRSSGYQEMTQTVR